MKTFAESRRLTAILSTLLSVGMSAAPAAGAASDLLLLAKAHEDLNENGERLMAPGAKSSIEARLSVLWSGVSAEKSIARIRAIEEPFYSSLGLAGVAAFQIENEPAAAAVTFREALQESMMIKSWTGTHPTSLPFILQLVPLFPERIAAEALENARRSWRQWEGSAYQKSSALLALCKATAKVEPDRLNDLLRGIALKSNHYWDSIEFLATTLARDDLEKTLKAATKHYREGTDWPNGQYYLRAVLIELAKTDFPRAFAVMKEMKTTDREVTGIQLMESLLEAKQFAEAQRVADYMDTLDLKLEYSIRSLEQLETRLDAKEAAVEESKVVPPKGIAAFLKTPDLAHLREITGAPRVVFHDLKQVTDFLEKALPKTEEIQDMGYPHHGSPRSRALGFLAVCAALTGDPQRALRIAESIPYPELRISYLLDAHEQVVPPPPAIDEWPLTFWPRVRVEVEKK